MVSVDMRKIYHFHPVEPAPSPDDLPTGGDLYYECTECAGVVSSVTRIKAACTCGNLSGHGGATTVKDPAKVRVVRGKLK
ncbi:hypothetical protein AGMMS50256_32290 [Betaproteobacteria bacterium]|nr:hypothetical protein AGMMS50256_32290 [Betaproteobacteria bacterium]